MKRHNVKIMIGKVVSDKMDKTITVEVIRTTRHSLYNRVIKVAKKYKAHDEENKACIGDMVKIIETRPLSKTKRWRLLEILDRRDNT